MAGPWERYGAPAQGAGLGAGPWERYSAAGTAPQRPGVPSLAEGVLSGAELLGSAASGAFAQIPAGLGGLGAMATNAMGLTNAQPADVVNRVQQALTYEPRTPHGQAAAEELGQIAGTAGRYVDMATAPILRGLGQLSPTAENVARTAVPAVAEAAGTIIPATAPMRGAMGVARGLPEATFARDTAMAARTADAMTPPVLPARTAEEVLSRMNSPQSMGAAAASPNISNVSPEIREAITAAAQRNAGAINPAALARHIEADTLPVRIRLTEGQALQDPIVISREMNERATKPDIVRRYNEQNAQLAENVRAIREEIGTDVFSTNATEHADTIIAAYREIDEGAQRIINQRYMELRDAAGGQFPVDGRALLENAEAELHRRLLHDFAPPRIMNTMRRLADEGMTFENFEALRTNLARIQRSSTIDGNEKAAAGVIRQALEDLPLAPDAAGSLKPLADSAREAARARFRAIEADPAYRAVVEETVPADRFVSRHIINAPRDDLALMRQNLADNPRALQTMSVATLDHLRGAARLDPYYNGNFASASYNKALQLLAPKLQHLVSPRTAEHLEQLGNVSRYISAQPRGSYVNNSNTFVAAAGERAARLAEKAGNMAVPGLDLGTAVRGRAQQVRAAREARRTLAPGAGLDRLDER